MRKFAYAIFQVALDVLVTLLLLALLTFRLLKLAWYSLLELLVPTLPFCILLPFIINPPFYYNLHTSSSSFSVSGVFPVTKFNPAIGAVFTGVAAGAGATFGIGVTGVCTTC